jgi:hypothetical protein
MYVANSPTRVSRTRTWLARSMIAVATAAALGSAALVPSTAHAGVFISVNFAPPVLPVYVQPAIPAPGYMWTPGYWAYAPVVGYYWVPGTWVMPPYVGALWTPGYWGWAGGVYAFHAGYWGAHVGFYGGVNYGYGYGGVGYAGGAWGPGGFSYNRSVNNFGNVHITNVYDRTVVVNNNVSRVSYNGGSGGLTTQPNAEEMRYANEQHTSAVAAQMNHENMARQNPAMRATVNHGSPTIAATSRPGTFAAHPTGPGATNRPAVRSANYAPHANGAPVNNFAAHNAQAVRPPAPLNRPAAQPHYNAPAPHANARPAEHESHNEHR